MTFEKLANLVADSFREDMVEHGFKNFTEMKKCYWWTTRDVKREFEAIISEIAKDMNAEFWMADDGSFVQLENFETMEYRDFSKLVRNNLKK